MTADTDHERTDFAEYQCDRCGTSHDSLGTVLACCGDDLDDARGVGR